MQVRSEKWQRKTDEALSMWSISITRNAAYTHFIATKHLIIFSSDHSSYHLPDHFAFLEMILIQQNRMFFFSVAKLQSQHKFCNKIVYCINGTAEIIDYFDHNFFWDNSDSYLENLYFTVIILCNEE